MNLIIYLIAFFEGFTTLSVEIVALRYFTPIVGSNSISTSIVLGVILLALSYGYYVGGKMTSKNIDLNKRLLNNLLISSIYYYFISFLLCGFILKNFLNITGNYFFSILISSFVLFFIPVFFASQTIPLLSEIMKGSNSGEKIGKLLFYSTIGSFLGSIGTSTFFFPLIGVFKTGIISSILLSLCALIINFVFHKSTKMQFIIIIILSFFLNSLIFFDNTNTNIIFSKSNAYHNIEIYDKGDLRIFSLNGAYSSGINIYTKQSFFTYINEATRKIEELKPKNILVIGAAGFTFPNDISGFDFVENIDVIDVDSSLKTISQKYFLEKNLSEKIHFYPLPSRYFVNNIKEKKYDFILVDAYSGDSIPPQLLTKEFFESLTKIGDNIFLNIIFDNNIESNFSKTILSTINNAFGKSYYKLLNLGSSKMGNIMVTNSEESGYTINNYLQDKIYTDNLNSIEIDVFEMRQEYKY